MRAAGNLVVETGSESLCFVRTMPIFGALPGALPISQISLLTELQNSAIYPALNSPSLSPHYHRHAPSAIVVAPAIGRPLSAFNFNRGAYLT